MFDEVFGMAAHVCWRTSAKEYVIRSEHPLLRMYLIRFSRKSIHSVFSMLNSTSNRSALMEPWLMRATHEFKDSRWTR